jgi:predicted SAM-dependent methyltransferase
MPYTDFARAVGRRISRDLRSLPYRMRRRSQIDSYLNVNPVRKLHLGAGSHDLSGWLNADLIPRGDEIYLNAVKRYPFESGTFDFIYHEHLIEHMPYEFGRAMLAECYRVLRSGGTMRIATPDLAFLIDLFGPEKTPLQRQYIEWSCARWTPYAPLPTEAFVINNYVRNWGHHFIYDRETLELALMRAGFMDVAFLSLNESDFPDLCGLENETRNPEGFLALETMVVESRKP